MIRKEKLDELRSYMEELKTIVVQRSISKPKFIEVKRYDCLLNNDEIISREEIVKNNGTGSAVIVLPITKENNTVLVVEPRVFCAETVGVGLPAGYIEEQENPIVSAMRELKEETGYVSNNLIKVAEFYQDEGCSRALNRSYIALDAEKVTNQKLDESEFIRYFECTFDEALELVNLGYIKGANSILTLEKAKQYVKGR